MKPFPVHAVNALQPATSGALSRDAFVCQPPVPGWNRELLGKRQIAVIGVGALGSRVAEHLAGLGATDFVLVDPKRYDKVSNVSTQCSPPDLGQHKVRVVGARLRRLGARVLSCPKHVQHIEPGWVGPESVIVVAGDNLAVQKAAHDLALLLRRPLAKLNVEPSCLAVSFRYFDYSRPFRTCLLCSWSEREYASQEAVASCDPTEERPTGSPRALSDLAAGMGALLIAGVVCGRDEAIVEREHLLTAVGPTLHDVHLPSNPDCLGRHDAGDPPIRLEGSPRTVTLERLARRSGFRRGKVWISGSGHIAMLCRCVSCGRTVRGIWWVKGPDLPVANCTCRGSGLYPHPFHTLCRVEGSELGNAWSRPLDTLGVPRKAAVTLDDDSRETTFILD